MMYRIKGHCKIGGQCNYRENICLAGEYTAVYAAIVRKQVSIARVRIDDGVESWRGPGREMKIPMYVLPLPAVLYGTLSYECSQTCGDAYPAKFCMDHTIWPWIW